MVTQDLAVIPAPAPPQIIRPVATPEQALDAWQTFQDLKARLITADDLQNVGGRNAIKKSGWRKIAAAFGLDTELRAERRISHENGKGFTVECTVRAIAPNGRHADGVGSFDSTERRMAHPEHDVRATAFTRACNRAISDLVGGGEESAEEIRSTPRLSREQAAELITQFDRSCDVQNVPFDYRSLAVQLLQDPNDLRRAFKHFKERGGSVVDASEEDDEPVIEPD